MLRLADLVYRVGGRTVLDGAAAALPARARVGLVGRNGAGKTTLLRLIAGELHPEAGEIAFDGAVRVGTLPQEAPEGPESPLEAVLAADGERSALLAEAETARDPERIASIHIRLGEIGAHSAEARAAEILAGLGFADAEMRSPCAALSGGWRMRVALAALLFSRPDLLLLDEPTNHLDLEATLWLEGFLARSPGGLIVVSHDRSLLDRVADRILHLDAGRLTLYGGNYTAFVRARAERRAFAAKENAKLLEQRRRMTAFVERFRAKATKARQAQSRLKAIEKLPPVVPVLEDRAPVFDLPEPEALPSPVLALDGVEAGYGDGPPVLRRLTLRLDMDDRIALIGANGNGKSTLARLLTGRLAPRAGRVTRNPRLRIGYFAQHQLDELDGAASAYRHLARLAPQGQEARLRAHLGRFGLSQDLADLPARRLSGGEKARLVLALITWAEPHLLVLDEPTNHLDIEAREALVEALNAFPGAVVLISHDARTITHCAERLWLVEGGTCAPFDGDLADYEARVIEARRAGRRDGDGSGGGDARKAARREAAEARAAAAPLRRAAEAADAALARCAEALEAIEARLAEPALYDGPSERLTALLKRRGELEKALAEAEAAWIAAHERLEAAMAR